MDVSRKAEHKKLKHGIRTGNTFKDCPKCRKQAIDSMDLLVSKTMLNSHEETKCSLEECCKSEIHNMGRMILRGNPLRGRDKFVACAKKHRSGSWTCYGSRTGVGQAPRVHLKGEYKALKTKCAEDAIDESFTEKSIKDYKHQSMKMYW